MSCFSTCAYSHMRADGMSRLRGLAPATGVHPEAKSALETGRRLARNDLVEWGWFAPENRDRAAIDADGLDADLVALCTRPA